MNARALLTFAGVLLATAWLYHESDRVGPAVKQFLARPRKSPVAPAAMPEELAKVGRTIAAGEGGASRVTRGRCLLCHTLGRDDVPGFGPTLFAVAEMAKTRVAAPATNAGASRSRARTSVEYLVESLVCPSCFIVPGFGEEGSHDRVSPMPRFQKPPAALSALELVAVVEWLLTKDGGRPAEPDEIKAAVLAFTPIEDQTPTFLDEQPLVQVRVPRRPGEDVGEMVALLSDDLPPQQILLRTGCTICHAIPGVTHAPCGAFALEDCLADRPAPTRLLGPTLTLKTTAARRVASREYQADRRAGRARARTSEEYVVESIVRPDAHTVQCAGEGTPGMDCRRARAARSGGPGDEPFAAGIMAAEELHKKLSGGAMRTVVQFLLTVDAQGPSP